MDLRLRHVGFVVVWLNIVSLAFCALENCNEVIDKTNPFVGSGGLGYGYGSVSPAASFPQSPMRLGPDSSSSAADVAFQHFSGYFYPDKDIRMFSHTRYVGAGINGLGAFGIMPSRKRGIFSDEEAFSSELGRDRKRTRKGEHLWWSDFDKETEKAHAGYYKVELAKPKVEAQMLATSRLTATHSYKWLPSASSDAEEGEAVIIIDALHQSHAEDMIFHGGNATIDIARDGLSFGASYQAMGYTTFMYAELKGVDSTSTYTNALKPTWLTCHAAEGGASKCERGSSSYRSNGGDLLVAALSLGSVPADESVEVELHVALSFVSLEQAKLNLQGLLPSSSSFSEQLEATKQAWCEALSFFSFDTLEDEKEEDGFTEMLITAASRSRMTPAIYSEGLDHIYTGLDQHVHNATSERVAYKYQQPATMGFYSDFSLWDIFRTQLPWLLLTDEPASLGILRSLAEMTAQQGGFPKWTSASVDKHVMVGLPGASMALEASFIPGLEQEFDLETIQSFLQQQATTPDFPVNPREDVAFYLQSGYVSSEAVEKGSSHTLSYAVDDYILARLSKVLGKEENYQEALLRSTNYKNIFDAEHLIMCPRSTDGTMACPEHPQRDFDHYIEGNALHWSYFVPHDIPGLKSLFPSEKVFEQQLEAFFDKHVTFQKAYGSLLPNPYFWAGNEVTMLTPWLFNFGKSCHKTQYWTRSITHMHFNNGPSGLPGNDDYASMSTFLLFSSLGIYPAATQDYYLIGSPRVKSASLQLTRAEGSYSALRIETHDNSADNVYVQKLLVNGQEWTETKIPTSVLKAPEGCTLEYFMTNEAASGLCQ